MIEQQEFDVQGIEVEAVFLHEINENMHIGIAYELEEERFIVFCVENGNIYFSVANMWDDFDYAHCDFMRLYESKRQERSA